MKNRHLAMRLGKFDLTSQRPSPRLRTRGIPNGQRNCNVLMSSPMIRLSAAGSSLSHSRTGSRPADVEKKIIGSCLLSKGRYVSFLVLFASLSSAKRGISLIVTASPDIRIRVLTPRVCGIYVSSTEAGWKRVRFLRFFSFRNGQKLGDTRSSSFQT